MELQTKPALRTLEQLDARREAERVEEERTQHGRHGPGHMSGQWASSGVVGPAIPDDWLASSW